MSFFDFELIKYFIIAILVPNHDFLVESSILLVYHPDSKLYNLHSLRSYFSILFSIEPRKFISFRSVNDFVKAY